MELRTVDNKVFDQHIASGGGGFAVLGPEGDTKSIWDKDSADEVEVAREQFNKLVAKGYSAFKVGKEGEKLSERMTTFDPTAGKVIFAKPIVGG